MKTIKYFPAFCLFISITIILNSCAIIRPGEVAVKVRYGKIQSPVLEPGFYLRGIFFTKIERFSTRITEYTNKIDFHSMEGIEVSSDLTLLYHMIPDSAISIYPRFDGSYEKELIINNVVTAMRKEGLHNKAVELITKRAEIEQAIKENLTSTIGRYGFVIDNVLLKTVHLPEEVTKAIQAKLTAEQVSKRTDIDLEIQRKNLDYQIEKDKKEAELEVAKQRIALNFIIEKQNKENERLLIESEGVKKSQEILNSSITDKLIKFKALEITRDLVKSPNTRVIITDGKSPVLLSDK